MVRLVEVVLKPGKRACPPLATPAAGQAAWDARPTPATPGWGCRGNYTTAGDASTFRHLLEQNEFGGQIFQTVKAHLKEHGMAMKQGTIIDATLIAAPSSTLTEAGGRAWRSH